MSLNNLLVVVTFVKEGEKRKSEEMKEFTSEWIAKQKKLVEKLPRHSKYEYIDIRNKELIAVGDIDPETNSSNASSLLFTEYEEDTKAVRDCILYYYEALDKIERLQAERDQVCEWKGIRYSPPGLPTYYVYSSPHSASLWITTNKIEYFTFCPICGKRIKYVEES